MTERFILRRLFVRAALSLAAAATLAVGASSPAAAAGPLGVSIVYLGNPGDAGWTHAHDLGIAAAEKTLGPQIKVTRIENVPENADAERVFRDRAAKGDKVVIGTSFGYMDAMLRVSRDFPDTVFLHCSGYKSAPNFGNFNGKVYESAYLAGVVAGYVSKSHVLGFVGSVPIPEVVRNIDAFALGARSVAPQTVVKVVWVSSWFDPGKERQAAETLVGLGADVLMQNTDSTATMAVAEQRGVHAFGWDSDMSRWGPHAHLGSVAYDWGIYYTKAIDEIRSGTWTSKPVYWGVKEGITDLVNVNPAAVPPEAQRALAERRAALVAGRVDPFAGPLKDQSGKLRVAANATLSATDANRLDWFVEGVDGKLVQ
ncbi:nucleoside-binding protein [Paraburkholderia caballeronis]|uniref:BMP family ABC transporter substrate-binding protein n=1 Tax=Paraburkholderia caballeronis TaxID=416943 RepID=UPI001064BA04|nr:BMP family ABC transporter substrate-binding protein [Paraburkholderia caballeronis]TDV27285.1 nucleoside-binding protein [Paraburkholderia caballeronis]